MPLLIKFSIEHEKERIKKTIEKLPWYEDHAYSPRFPQGVNPKTDKIEKIFLALKNEYIEKDYKKIANQLGNEFSRIENDFYNKLEIIFRKKIRQNFQIILTQYGVGGSYRLPNKIIYNFAMKSSSVYTVLHEIIHLLIESYITKYKIEQNEKERIVDLILKSEPLALSDYKMQKRGEECKKYIDPLFGEYFKPPIDDFFKKLSKLKS